MTSMGWSEALEFAGVCCISPPQKQTPAAQLDAVLSINCSLPPPLDVQKLRSLAA